MYLPIFTFINLCGFQATQICAWSYWNTEPASTLSLIWRMTKVLLELDRRYMIRVGYSLKYSYQCCMVIRKVRGAPVVGSLPIHQAALGGYTNVVQKLIEKGSEVSVPDMDGYTALHVGEIFSCDSFTKHHVKCLRSRPMHVYMFGAVTTVKHCAVLISKQRAVWCLTVIWRHTTVHAPWILLLLLSLLLYLLLSCCFTGKAAITLKLAHSSLHLCKSFAIWSGDYIIYSSLKIACVLLNQFCYFDFCSIMLII